MLFYDKLFHFAINFCDIDGVLWSLIVFGFLTIVTSVLYLLFKPKNKNGDDDDERVK